MGTLTVRENLQFSAALRLPRSLRQKEKDERINQIIKELGLTKVADAKVVWIEAIVSMSTGMLFSSLACKMTILILYLVFRLALSSSVVCLEERGREQILVWSSLLTRGCYSWMSQPLVWMPVLPMLF